MTPTTTDTSKPPAKQPEPPAAILDPHKAGRWYVVQSKPGAELLASHRLNAVGFPVFYPHYRGTISHAGKRLIGVMRPLYPRYLFVAVDDRHGLYSVEKTIGVSGVVHLGTEALTIPARVIAEQMERTDAHGRLAKEVAEKLGLVLPEKVRHQHRFDVGDTVRFKSGYFAGFLGIVERLDKNDSLRVCVEMFGRGVPTDAHDADLEPGPG